MKDKQLILQTWREAIGGAYYNTLIKAAKYIDQNVLETNKREFIDDY